MKVKNSKLLIIASVLLIIIAGLVLANVYEGKRSALGDKCTAVMEVSDADANFSASVNVMMLLNPAGHGLIGLSGVVHHDGGQYILSRELKLTYERAADDVYNVRGLVLIKHTQDHVSDSLMDRFFFNTETENGRHMTLSKMHNAYIIGNLHSPVFICVVK